MILARLFRFVPVDMHPRQLVPAVRAHRLQLGVALERRDGFVEALQADQHQAKAVPGAVELGVEFGGAAQCGFGSFERPVPRAEAVVEPVRWHRDWSVATSALAWYQRRAGGPSCALQVGPARQA